ncbi:MAG TPA: tetratricopeptide repeat-containing sensor histidine kinase [Prolixibacteraceae bacterium]|nr:tetratricopeptide repeat-containing sensor histidine kinase [Prolixibacteraceae bacterium]
MQNFELEEAKNIINDGLNKKKTSKNEHNKTLLTYMLGDYYYYKQDFSKARQHYLLSTEKLKEYQDTVYLMMALNSIGLTYSFEHNKEKTLEYYLKALDASSHNTQNKRVQQERLNATVNIINHYFAAENYKDVIEGAPQAISLALELNDSTQLASIYNALAVANKNTNNYNEAKKHFSNALNIYNEQNDTFRKAYIHNNLAGLYEKYNHPDTAQYYYELALTTFEENEYLLGIAKSKLGIASILGRKGDYNSAETLIGDVITITKDNQFNNVLLNAYFELAELKYSQNQFKKAYDTKTLYHSLKDSIFNAENQEKYAELETRYETNKKEHQIALLKNEMLQHQLATKKSQLQKEIGLSFIMLLLIVVLVIFLFYKRKKTINQSLVVKNKFIEEQNIKLQALIDKNDEITKKLQQSRHELMITNATKNRFFSILAHDLRSPFHNIIGLSFILSSTPGELTPQQLKEHSNGIYSSANQIKRLLDNLLEWGKTQIEERDIAIQKINVHETINSSINILEDDASFKSINITNSVDDELTINSDPDILETISRNIINNSIKFTHPGGSIHIKGSNQNHKAIISIEDTGIGIEKEAMKKLFRIDSKYRHAGTNNEKGTGLGLVICAELIKKLNGQIKVESTVGKGTVFHIEIPG